jgi:lysozyme
LSDALALALPLIKGGEGLCLRAYPDPGSALYKALARANLLRRYMKGEAEIPPALRALSGAPWTIGFGETAGVREGMWWTEEQAEARLLARVAGFAAGVLKRCPRLAQEPAGRLAACTSLAYNTGLAAFGVSSICRCTARLEYRQAGDAFLLWNKAGGRVMPGLTLRRGRERALYLVPDAR